MKEQADAQAENFKEKQGLDLDYVGINCMQFLGTEEEAKETLLKAITEKEQANL